MSPAPSPTRRPTRDHPRSDSTHHDAATGAARNGPAIGRPHEASSPARRGAPSGRTDGDASLDGLPRRTYLKSALLAGASIAGLATQTGTAAAASGYGEAGFGDGGYGGSSTVTAVAVSTDAPTGVGGTTATLNATLDDLGGATSADCAFDFREAGASTWTRSATTTRSTVGSFGASIDGLAGGTEYEYRARASASDGDVAAGSVLTFVTAAVETPPTIERFDVTEAGKPNPHADISVDWAVADAGGDLDGVAIEVTEPATGAVLDTRTDAASGASASGRDAFSYKHVDGVTFAVTLTVADRSGSTASATTTVTE